ncbi:MAG: FHA domain-containing protein [Acidimicrobiia bacterium]|nr:FHA domain-containing protein [Acidimicrobiia bacterium]
MPPLALHLLKIGFITALYIFLWVVGRGIAGHLKRESARSEAPTVAITESPTQAGMTFRVSGPLILGRSPEADVVLQDPYASDFHIRLAFQGGEVRLHDLGSTNGTQVNGERVVAPLALRRGDRVQVGQTIMEIR